MELTYDWRTFQTMFYPQRGSNVQPVGGGTAYVIVSGDTIMAAFADHENLYAWVGESYREIAAQNPSRELIVFERDQVDKWVSDSMPLKSFYDQVEFLRAHAKPSPVSQAGPSALTGKRSKRSAKKPAQVALKFRQHFLLEALHSTWWAKALPSSYGIFIRLEGSQGHPAQDLLMVIRRGKFEAFIEPDLHSIGPDRKKQPSEVVRYLSEKHLVKVQGILMAAEEWSRFAQSADPWREVAKSIRAHRTKLVPFRWSVAALASARGFLRV